MLFIKTASLRRIPAQFHNVSIPPRRYYRSQTQQRDTNSRDPICEMLLTSPWSIRSGFVDVQSSNNAVARRFSFPPSLKCPFCRQFLRALFDRLFSLARYYPSVLIYNATVALKRTRIASARVRRVRRNPILPELGRENFVPFFRTGRDRFSLFLFPQKRSLLLSHSEGGGWPATIVVSFVANLGAPPPEIWHSDAKYPVETNAI